ncbi:MAG TPA: SAM-dependent methyltransferase [Bryobacteraceae bacterium]|nr:SAM-dependent methyltransferase [Bryobacteraceae bacterium]
MNALGLLLADEIRRDGPMRFSRFMEQCLYHPEHGYYRRDHFGRAGDFFTAEQMQPVFGRLAAQWIRQCAAELGAGRPLVIELGAGRREMAEAFSQFEYVPVEIDSGQFPARFSGVVFSNEFFDALPVDLVARTPRGPAERRVAMSGDRFVWAEGPPVQVEIPAEVEVVERQDTRVEWMHRIGRSMDSGHVITIDYGFTTRELVRFPQGTLMAYRGHRASDDVLATPGERDITAHVDFTALQEAGQESGLETVRYESLASALLRAGEQDEFAGALYTDDPAESQRLRNQLKTLLFGMGETFRVLVQRKVQK